MIKKISRNKYQFIVNQGSGDTRRRFSKTVVFDGGKKALQKLYDEYEAEVLSQVPQTDISVEELLDNHISYTETLGRKATTIRGYKKCAERFDAR